MIYPEPDNAGRAKKGKASETGGFSQSRLKAARAVLRLSAQFDTKMASAVVAGDLSLDAALEKMNQLNPQLAAQLARRFSRLLSARVTFS